MLEQIRDLYYARLEKYGSMKLAPSVSLEMATTPVYVGSQSLSALDQSERIISNHIRLAEMQEIPPVFTRLYLQSKYDYKRPVSTWQLERFKDKRPPLYANPVTGEMVYIDITSAYWQIVSAYGWDVDYAPGRGIAQKSTMEDFPLPDNRLARNSLVTAGLPAMVSIYNPHTEAYYSKKIHNPLINLGLYALVMDVLNGVAWDMIDHAKALYVHTDGVIVHMDRVAQAEEVMNAWGLKYKIKASGRGHVKGVGCYAIEDYWTKGYHKRREAAFLGGIRPPDAIRWLRDRTNRFTSMNESAHTIR